MDSCDSLENRFSTNIWPEKNTIVLNTKVELSSQFGSALWNTRCAWNQKPSNHLMAFKAPLRHMEKLAQEQRFPSPRAALPSCCSLLIRKVLQSSGDPFQDIWGGGRWWQQNPLPLIHTLKCYYVPQSNSECQPLNAQGVDSKVLSSPWRLFVPSLLTLLFPM